MQIWSGAALATEVENPETTAMRSENDTSGAQAEFAEAVRLKPLYAEGHYNLALALQQEGKETEARAEFDKAFEISPELRNAPRP